MEAHAHLFYLVDQEIQEEEVKSSFIIENSICITYWCSVKFVDHFSTQVLTFVVLIIWFWRMPVANISEELLQPFDKMLSWRAGGALKDHVMVGIIPWLMVSARVNRFIYRKVLK
ncbi:uncharacterized protein LOC111398074 [Olea europaea var. sylvestris]|uniref:uncharacterized protein LOC111398074 n=1 Tax=Olea europaea var. sylvestris TaxID=158386 RepID=UPI000C1D24A1|nr:uncharacterized protein LOC111398074 [Olea europaea var. sylvestris]